MFDEVSWRDQAVLLDSAKVDSHKLQNYIYPMVSGKG